MIKQDCRNNKENTIICNALLRFDGEQNLTVDQGTYCNTNQNDCPCESIWESRWNRTGPNNRTIFTWIHHSIGIGQHLIRITV